MKRETQVFLCFLLFTVCACSLQVSTLDEPTQSPPVSVLEASETDHILSGPILQLNNGHVLEDFLSKPSIELQDNHIGDMYSLYPQAHPEHPGYEDPQEFAERIDSHGLKWMRVSLDWFDGEELEKTKTYTTFEVDPVQDAAIDALISKGIDVYFSLAFWDDQIQTGEGYSRFTEEEEIERYLEYARFIVSHFKGRIKYYFLVNEPDRGQGTQQYVKPEDYAKMAKRAIPAIREIDPDAEIIIGEVTPLIWPNSIQYIYQILDAELLPLADGISWHSAGWASPEYMEQEYYEYQNLIEDVVQKAEKNGFKGEYWTTEMHWRTADSPHPDEFDGYTGLSAAKYLAGSIVRHRGYGFHVGLAENLEHIQKEPVIENLCTLLAGAKPAEISVAVGGEINHFNQYGFETNDGDLLIAIWSDVPARDDFQGIVTKLRLEGIQADMVIGIDVLNSKQQELLFSSEEGSVIVPDVVIRDYPMFFLFK